MAARDDAAETAPASVRRKPPARRGMPTRDQADVSPFVRPPVNLETIDLAHLRKIPGDAVQRLVSAEVRGETRFVVDRRSPPARYPSAAIVARRRSDPGSGSSSLRTAAKGAIEIDAPGEKCHVGRIGSGPDRPRRHRVHDVATMTPVASPAKSVWNEQATSAAISSQAMIRCVVGGHAGSASGEPGRTSMIASDAEQSASRPAERRYSVAARCGAKPPPQRRGAATVARRGNRSAPRMETG